MKIRIKPIHASPCEAPAVTYEGLLDVTLSKVFCGVKIVTEDGAEFGVALRDTGLEITCPAGELVGIKLCDMDHLIPREGPRGASFMDLKKGQAFIERNGKVIG